MAARDLGGGYQHVDLNKIFRCLQKCKVRIIKISPPFRESSDAASERD